MKRILGIDPGYSGALCILTIHDDGVKEVVFEPMPIIRSVTKTKSKDGKTKSKTSTELDFQELCRIFGSLIDCTAYLERVHAMPKQGVSSVFNFGLQFGALKAMLHAHRIPHYEVTPQAWQKRMHEGVPAQHDPKAKSLIACRRIFPDVNLARPEGKFADEGFVDALLIAEYGRRALASTRLGS